MATKNRRRALHTIAVFVAAALLIAASPRVVVKVDADRILNSFDPRLALGAGLDGHEQGDIPLLYTQDNIRAMLGAGLGAITYRLRTELAIDAWHFVAEGKFSEGDRGYWSSDWAAAKPARESYGYSLPRQGNTTDEANNDGYSRLDDGDPKTFWKSNPYLDRHFTGESNSMHPQWALLDFGKDVRLNTVRIDWGIPAAKRFEVQLWQGAEDFGTTDGAWKTVYRSTDGGAIPQFPAIFARYLRVRLLESSGSDSPDIRASVGFAINEIYAGWTDERGKFQDAIRHGRGRDQQTLAYVSSTDSWHRREDRDRSVEQPGFDTVWQSGLCRNLPMLIPVPVLFGTPEESANIVRYLRRRGIPIRGIEMGEEPDGQFVEPEDYGALYLQVADAIHKVDPKLVLGGPCFEEIQVDVVNWPQPVDTPGWTKRFVDYLRKRRRLSDLGFFSFEWYPFDNLGGDTSKQLRRAPRLLEDALKRYRKEGLPPVPLYMTEYGYSAFSGRNEVDLPGAVLNADIVGKFLSLGGAAAFLYGYEPSSLEHDGSRSGWGNNTIFVSDDERKIIDKTATYWSARLLTQSWCQPEGGIHRVLRTDVDTDRVAAYSVRRPDGAIAVLLVNKSGRDSMPVQVDGVPAGQAMIEQFGPDQYEWRENGIKGRPKKSDQPRQWTQASTSVVLPPYSVTVIHLLGK